MQITVKAERSTSNRYGSASVTGPNGPTLGPDSDPDSDPDPDPPNTKLTLKIHWRSICEWYILLILYLEF